MIQTFLRNRDPPPGFSKFPNWNWEFSSVFSNPPPLWEFFPNFPVFFSDASPYLYYSNFLQFQFSNSYLVYILNFLIHLLNFLASMLERRLVIIHRTCTCGLADNFSCWIISHNMSNDDQMYLYEFVRELAEIFVLKSFATI